MAISNKAKLELRALLKRYRAAHSVTSMPSGAGKAMEAWVLMRLAKTAEATYGWKVSLRKGNGLPLTSGATFILPGGPSRIPPPPAAGSIGHCFVLLESSLGSGFNLELRGSVQWVGRSGAKHEFDISVIPATVSESIRRAGGGSPSGAPIAAIECKDKKSSGTLDEVRQALARLFDVTHISTTHILGSNCRIFENISPATTLWGNGRRGYRDYFKKGVFAIVRAGNFQRGTQNLANYYSILRASEAYSYSSNNLAAIEHEFTRALRGIHTF